MMDLNCDLGEGLNNEHLLMPLVSSCNIACGGHAGSVDIMDRVISLAVHHDVKIGVHPGFVDKENFGRVTLDILNKELYQGLVDQMELFKSRAELQNINVHHVKPHGALYNLTVVDRRKAEIVVKAIQHVFNKIKIYAPYNSEIVKVARKAKIQVVYEAFADRNYNDDLTLVSRKEPNAILLNSDEIIKHVSRMANESIVKTVTGKEQIMKAETFCVHGDHENTLDILNVLNQQFMTS